MLNLYNINNHKKSVDGNSSNPILDVENKNIKKSDFKNYISSDDSLSGNSLQWGMWYVKNKIKLYKSLLGFLVVISIFLWGFSLWSIADYLIFGMQKDSKIMNDLSIFNNYENINNNYSAKPIQIIGTELFRSGVDKSDAVANVLNPNNNFLVRFSYYFDFGGYKTPLKKVVLLPSEGRPITYGGIKNNFLSGRPKLVLENIYWERIDNHIISDVSLWIDKHLDFSVSDFSFIRPQAEDGADAYILQFKLKNNSAFGYKLANFQIGLLNSNTLVGVLPLVIEDFKSGEVRNVDIRNFSSNLSVSDVQIYPEIDITDQENFMVPER